MLTVGLGQRIGIFGGSGVGKSTLIGMMTRNTSADVVVVGLVGERGREVGEFLDRRFGGGRPAARGGDCVHIGPVTAVADACGPGSDQCCGELRRRGQRRSAGA